MSVGPAEILVILIVALLVFGPQRLPEVGRQVGAALRELRKMQDAVRGELDMVLHPEHGTSSAPAGGEDPATTEPAMTEPGGHAVVDPAALEAPSRDQDPADTMPEPTDHADESRFSGPTDSFL